MAVKVLVTGATGFVGRQLLTSSGHDFIAVSRQASTSSEVAIGDMSDYRDWQTLFQGVEVIVHLAARVHQMSDGDPGAYQRDNVEVVQRMASAAVAAGVRRFIFISSIKVNGEITNGRPFTAQDPPLPVDLYGQSKAKAEAILLAAADQSAMQVVIIRPPLVYGPGVKANFKRLMQLANWPLPFAAIHNRRDMVSVFNLCDLILCCIDHSAAQNQIFLVSDGKPYGLSTLLQAMSKVQGRRSWLWPFPCSILRGCLQVLGKDDFAQRLLGDLEVDISHTVTTLNWHPKYSLKETLRTMQI